MDRNDFYTMARLLNLNVCAKMWKASFVHIFVLIWIFKALICSSFKDSRLVLLLVIRQGFE